MPNDASGKVGATVGALLIALATAGTAPWWWAKVFPESTRVDAPQQKEETSQGAKLIGIWRFHRESDDKAKGTFTVKNGTIQFMPRGAYQEVGELIIRLAIPPNTEIVYDYVEAGEWNLDKTTLFQRQIDIKSAIRSLTVNGQAHDPESAQTKASFPRMDDYFLRSGAATVNVLRLSDTSLVTTTGSDSVQQEFRMERTEKAFSFPGRP